MLVGEASAQTTATAGGAAVENSAPTASEREASAALSAHLSAFPMITASAAATSVVVDGRLDDAAWRAAVPATGFTATDPIDGARPSEATEVRILYEADALYVGARMHMRNGKVSTRLARRDSDIGDSDWFIVVFDSFHDHQGGYRFRINPSGVFGDEANGDRSWNPVWTVATSIDSAGWTAEIRIPFSQLRFNASDAPIWGVQFLREIGSTREKLSFSYTSKSERGGSARFGHLLGLREVSAGHRLELLPFVAASADYRAITRRAGVDFDNPYRDGSDYSRRAGLDLKYRPTSDLTLDVTMNPDFGQIEADEAQVNLSADETFLQEKRPFFIEGANIFRFTDGDLFYSRRLGRAPQGSVPSAARYSNAPEFAPILGAAKLTGRTSSGWSVGVLNAITGRASSRWIDAARESGIAEVEPRTNYFVARAKRDFRQGASTIGGAVTRLDRELGDSVLSLQLRRAATAAGADFRHEWAAREWVVDGSVAASRIEGSPSSLISTQRSSARYYQRPDNDYREIDSTATTMTGLRAGLGLSKHAGLHWRGGASVNATTPGFEINDMAFQTSADRINGNFNIEYQENSPGEVWRRWEVSLNPDWAGNFGGDLLSNGLKLEASGTLLNYYGGRLTFDHDFPSLDDRLTRGGPLARRLGQTTVALNVNSDMRGGFWMSANLRERRDPAGGWHSGKTLRFNIKPAPTLTMELAPRYDRSRGAAQYVTSVRDSFATSTYGRRYLFASIAQTTASVQARVNLTLTPEMTVALVAEPFIASGAYGAPKQLAAPRTFEFDQFGTDVGTSTRDSAGVYQVDPDGSGPAAAFTFRDPSFNSRSVNGTAAFRWEYAPGSTFYAVWQHRRSAPGTFGDFEFRRDRTALFAAHPENTLLVKLSYWVNP
ncbi:MAG TPA: DUF5916 domain-containing protein [Gemmatimonadaceae bacterium]|nr:DUF5916 domain-containing protein [Gemmatimonadaceae bacterium]